MSPDIVQAGSFPHEAYLQRRARQMFDTLTAAHSPAEVFAVMSDGLLQWQGAYVTDLSMKWSLRSIKIDELYLTGMDPAWNSIVLDQCQRSPSKFRQYLIDHPGIRDRVMAFGEDDDPIMLRDGKVVLDGMHRVLNAIGRGQESIQAYVCQPDGPISLQVPPGVPYVFARAYRMGALDEAGLEQVLRIMCSFCANMDPILERLTWEPDLIPIIEKVRGRPHIPPFKERLRLLIRRWLR